MPSHGIHKPTVNGVLAIRWRQFGILQPNPPADVTGSLVLAPGLCAQAAWTQSVDKACQCLLVSPLLVILHYILQCAQSPLVILTARKALFTYELVLETAG